MKYDSAQVKMKLDERQNRSIKLKWIKSNIFKPKGALQNIYIQKFLLLKISYEVSE